jgi:hypothetical protein
MVDSATPIPSINNPPWIVGAPQNGFWRPIHLISARTLQLIRLQPPTLQDFQCD